MKRSRLARINGKATFRFASIAFALLGLLAGLAFDPAAADAAEASWTLDRERDGITVHTRPVAGSGIREFKGSALVAAPVESIRALLRDADHFKDWFPN